MQEALRCGPTRGVTWVSSAAATARRTGAVVAAGRADLAAVRRARGTTRSGAWGTVRCAPLLSPWVWELPH